MKKLLLILLSMCFVFFLSANGAKEEQGDKQIKLKFLAMAQAAYSEEDVNNMTADFMSKNPNVQVSTEFVPYEELRNKTMLAYGSKHPYDAVLVDDIWFTEYVSKGMLYGLTNDIPADYSEGILSGGWNFTTKNDVVYGIPWFLDTMYLFYNEAMLKEAGFAEPPKSIEELAEMGAIMKEKGVVEYPFVFSLGQAEALICVFSNFLEAYQGSFQDHEGKYTLDTSGGVKALDYLVSLKDKGLLNPNSLEFLEEDVRRVFSSGDAAFTLNWSYMYGLVTDSSESQVSQDVGIMVLPGSDGITEDAAMSGSMGLSVLSSTKHPKEALDYILYLTSKQVQDKYSDLQLPVWTASYDNPEIKKGREDLVEASKRAFSIMNVRPSDPNYQEVSSFFQQYIQLALLGSMTSQAALSEAIEKVEGIK